MPNEISRSALGNPALRHRLSQGRAFIGTALRPGARNMVLSGVTRDTDSAVLGNCRVMVFRSSDLQPVIETVSDGSGNWSVPVNTAGPFFVVTYKTGSPDLAGTTVNTLVGVPG